MYDVLENIKNEAEDFLNKKIANISLRDKQILFMQSISVLDLLFEETTIDHISDEAYQDRREAIYFGYPTLIEKLYSDIEELPDLALSPISEGNMVMINKIVYSCQLIGWINNILEDIHVGFIQIEKTSKHKIALKHNDIFCWIEKIEKEAINSYSSLILNNQKSQYIELIENLSKILNQMRPLVYKWKNHYMGYNSTFDIDYFFYKNSLLDAQQAVEWDMFPKDALFDGIRFEVYVNTVVQFGGTELKHMQYAHLLMGKEPDLFLQNLFSRVDVEAENIKLIAENNDISKDDAKKVFNTLTLSANNKDAHIKTHSAAPLFLKISKTQYLRSICGCLDRPFEFLLVELRRRFPKEWDANTRMRENKFRTELYSFFREEHYIKIQRNILIKKNGKAITDIDACIIDKQSGTIALFQLKWQDLTYDSFRSLSSKRKNYNSKTNDWITTVKEWIDESTPTTLAEHLAIKSKYLDKSKIKLFVLGRFHGNFSGSTKPSDNCVWGQWYAFFQLAVSNEKHPNMLDFLFQMLGIYNPYNAQVDSRPVEYRIGKYSVQIR